MLRLVLAWLHLVALGIGLGAVIVRGSALRDAPDPLAMRRALIFDAVWGIAALLWLSTGLWRLFGETEKTLSYYMSNHAFFAKMGFFVLILALEIWPAIVLMRWRRAVMGGRGTADVDLTQARRIATISHIEALLVVLMVFAAVAMARGYGVMG
jgi:putative membrane protein